MPRWIFLAFLASLLVALVPAAAGASETRRPELRRPGETPAQARVRRARARVERAASGPERARGLEALASAHTRRARETGDPTHYESALEALEHARQEDPSGAEADRIEAWVRLGRHEFAAAEVLASARLRGHPEDHECWGLLGDARMELGDTEGAADAYQRMMDLRPGPGAYLRAAYFRERIGDLSGARELVGHALAATSLREVEDRAWILVQLASLEVGLARPSAAEAALQGALDAFPGYHYALAALAELKLQLGDPESALAFAQRALDAAPYAERLLPLAAALRALDRYDEARAAEDAFERAALAHTHLPDNENLALLAFYLRRHPRAVGTLLLSADLWDALRSEPPAAAPRGP